MSEYIGQILYIKPTMIVSVPEFDTPKFQYSIARQENARNLRCNNHNSKLSDKAIKRIKTAINWMVCASQPKKVYQKSTGKSFYFKVNLVTLTLPDTSVKITEHQFKKTLMHPFLSYMRKYHRLKNYVWKLEFQKNGKIHLHLTSDTFIHYSVLRDYWNSLMFKNGYLTEFIAKHKHRNPNSTDVHAVWKVKNLGAYLAKYLSKNEDSTEVINGRIWGCNHELSDKNKCTIGINRDECAIEMRPLMNPKIEYKEIVSVDSLTGKIYRNAELFFLKLEDWGSLFKGVIKDTFEKHLTMIRQATPHTNILFEL